MNARLPPASPTLVPDRALAPKTAIDEFEIERVLSSSSFSIVYRAYDHVLKLHVAIKEYLPDALAMRGGETQVVLRSRGAADRFRLGAQSFVGESQTLARCDHPSLVRVQRILQRHDTFYRVMRYTPGPTLLQWRRETGAPPAAAAMRGWLAGLLGALEALHDEGCVHGGVAPGNVLLLPGDKPILLDFDAVRGALISDHTQSMMAALEPCFAAPEQHSPTATSVEGAWTDLYSLAAMLRFCIGGELPPAPSALVAGRPAETFAALWQRMAQARPSLEDPPAWFEVLDACQQDDPGRRPQSFAQMRAMLADATTVAPSRRARAPRATPRYLSDLGLGPRPGAATAGTSQAPVSAPDLQADASTHGAPQTTAAPDVPPTVARGAGGLPEAPAKPGAAAESAMWLDAPPEAVNSRGAPPQARSPEPKPARGTAAAKVDSALVPADALRFELPAPDAPPSAGVMVGDAAPQPKPLSVAQSRFIADLDETFAFIARQANEEAAAPRPPAPPASPDMEPAPAEPTPPDNLLAALLTTPRGRRVLGVVGLVLLAALVAALFWLYRQIQTDLVGGGPIGRADAGLANSALAAVTTAPPLQALPDAPTAAGPAARPAPVAGAETSAPATVARTPKSAATPTASKAATLAGGTTSGAAKPAAAKTADPAAKVAAGPAKRCASRTGSDFDRCLKKQCAKKAYAGHPQCTAPVPPGA